MLIGLGKSRELIVLKLIYDALCYPIASAFIGFHSFTGCDTVSRFSGIKGKITCWKSVKKADKTSVQGFIDLGQADIPSEATISALERYICQLYLPGTSNEDPGGCCSRKIKQSVKSSPPPPTPPPLTKAALHQHILRANYQARIYCIWLTSQIQYLHQRQNMDGQTRRVVLSCENSTKTSSRCSD